MSLFRDDSSERFFKAHSIDELPTTVRLKARDKQEASAESHFCLTILDAKLKTHLILFSLPPYLVRANIPAHAVCSKSEP